MKTPLEYTKNLKNHIITPQMLLDCLYSSNKRAKNWRDKEQEYREFYRSSRYSYDKYDNEAKAREKKLKYYKQKEIMLSVLQPVCIHRECIGYERHRIYDYENTESRILYSVLERMFPDGEETYTFEEIKRLFEEEGVYPKNFEAALSTCIEEGWIIDCGNGNYTR